MDLLILSSGCVPHLRWGRNHGGKRNPDTHLFMEEPGECDPHQCLCLNCRCHLAPIALVFFWTGDSLSWLRGLVSVNQHAAVLKELHVLYLVTYMSDGKKESIVR